MADAGFWPVTLVVEGVTDVPVLTRVLAELGAYPHYVYGKSGKGQLDKSLAGYNSAARFSPWVIVRDLDADEDCAPTLRAQLLPVPSEHMCFRIAVREAEAWLLGDAEALGKYLRVPQAIIPNDPESLANPKATLVDLARQSNRPALRADLVPAGGTSGPVGPGYVSRIAEYAANYWRPAVAAGACDSLQRCLQRIPEILPGVS